MNINVEHCVLEQSTSVKKLLTQVLQMVNVQFHFINAQQAGFGLIMLHACTHGMYVGDNHIKHIQWHVMSLFMNLLLTFGAHCNNRML